MFKISYKIKAEKVLKHKIYLFISISKTELKYILNYCYPSIFLNFKTVLINHILN